MRIWQTHAIENDVLATEDDQNANPGKILEQMKKASMPGANTTEHLWLHGKKNTHIVNFNFHAM